MTASIYSGFCSYQFAKAKADDVKGIDWDLVVLDEAHRLRNVYKTSNVIAKTLKEALSRVHSKVLLTATPLQNSLLELYGLVSFIDDRVFGDLDSFRSQFTGREQSFSNLRDRLAPICKRTLRKQVQPDVSYTARKAIVEEFTPSSEEQELSRLVADYLRRPNLKALPEGQRQLISLVLWKLLASSTHAIAGALETMAKRLQGVLNETPVVRDLAEELDEDYESLDELSDERGDYESSNQDPDATASSRTKRDAIAQEIEELRHFKTLATNIRDNAKGKALLTALDRAFAELDRLDAPRKAIIFTESRRTQEYLLNLLAETPYGNGIVLFNGSNNDQRAKAIYKDRWGNPVINPEYNSAMLAEALAKLDGFSYAPSETLWWQHGHSSERDFIYVTTQNLSAEQLQALSDEVGPERSLLVCCAAFHGVTAAKAAERWPNLTLKKIPKMVLARCEWGHDDYSLNVANLPMVQPEPKTPPHQPSPKVRGKKPNASDAATPDMVGDGGEDA